jgi:hypothetical protein
MYRIIIRYKHLFWMYKKCIVHVYNIPYSAIQRAICIIQQLQSFGILTLIHASIWWMWNNFQSFICEKERIWGNGTRQHTMIQNASLGGHLYVQPPHCWTQHYNAGQSVFSICHAWKSITLICDFFHILCMCIYMYQYFSTKSNKYTRFVIKIKGVYPLMSSCLLIFHFFTAG